jgi:ElaB/YqjD/DUF883 family membrane-anchored ribosome-binding protein
MAAPSSMHFYLNWAKERIDEMDAALASLERKAAQAQAEARPKVDQFVADLKKRRDEFQSTVKKQAEAGEAAWEGIKVQLEKDRKSFEAEVDKYLETVGKDAEQKKAVFQGQVAAQMKAWRETADKIQAAAQQFDAKRRQDVDATVTRMKADCAVAEKELQTKLTQASTESLTALNAALAQTRAVFDRANQAAQEAFKRAVG